MSKRVLKILGWCHLGGIGAFFIGLIILLIISYQEIKIAVQAADTSTNPYAHMGAGLAWVGWFIILGLTILAAVYGLLNLIAFRAYLKGRTHPTFYYINIITAIIVIFSVITKNLEGLYIFSLSISAVLIIGTVHSFGVLNEKHD